MSSSALSDSTSSATSGRSFVQLKQRCLCGCGRKTRKRNDCGKPSCGAQRRPGRLRGVAKGPTAALPTTPCTKCKRAEQELTDLRKALWDLRAERVYFQQRIEELNDTVDWCKSAVAARSSVPTACTRRLKRWESSTDEDARSFCATT